MMHPNGDRHLAEPSLPDVVAASAGFPGLRPVIFAADRFADRPAETSAGRGVVARSILGSLALLVGIGVVATTVARAVGRIDLGVWIATIVLGVGAFWALTRPLRQQSVDALHLVDGGICDNLGPAFSL